VPGCRVSLPKLSEIIFEVTEDEVDGGYSASALGFGIHTQGDSLDDLWRNIKEAVDCYFEETMPRPKLIRLHMGGQARRRIPREFEPATDSATIVTSDDLAGVEPVRSSLPLAEVLPTLSPLKEDFPGIPDPPSEPEDIL